MEVRFMTWKHGMLECSICEVQLWQTTESPSQPAVHMTHLACYAAAELCGLLASARCSVCWPLRVLCCATPSGPCALPENAKSNTTISVGVGCCASSRQLDTATTVTAVTASNAAADANAARASCGLRAACHLPLAACRRLLLATFAGCHLLHAACCLL